METCPELQPIFLVPGGVLDPLLMALEWQV
jgi:hypothetical protein